MARHVFHWKHGWIPLDHTAISHGGHRSQATGPIRGDHADSSGVRSRRDVAHAVRTLAQVPSGPARHRAAQATARAADRNNARDILPSPLHAHLSLPPGDVAAFTGGSAEKHLEPDGKGGHRFTTERAQLHASIVEHFLSGATPVASPVYNVMGGGPASGKSTMERHTPALASNAALVNPDEAKARLPEYAGGTGAAFTHEESSYVAKLAVSEAFARRVNVTLDGTGDSDAAKLRSKMQAARDAGYGVNGYYVTIPTDEAVHRAELRGQRSGRFVNETVIRETHAAISRVLPEVANDFDELHLYDNSGPQLTHVLAKRHGHKPEILNPAMYQAFLAKGTEGQQLTDAQFSSTVG